MQSHATEAAHPQLEVTFSFKPRPGRRRSQKVGGPQEAPLSEAFPGTIPRVSRLMALAIRFEGLIQDGEVQDYADLARLGHVTRARITQIMDLNLLAPDIQEQILHLPATIKGPDPIREKDIRVITAAAYWPRQRKLWARLLADRLK